MRRRLVQVGDGWAFPLSAEQLSALGVGEADTAVLVQLQGGDPPRLVIRRALTFAEAMEETLDCHDEALARLAIFDTATGGQTSA